MTDQSKHFPGEQFEVRTRKDKFTELNREITQLGGWIVSVPGAREVRFQVLPGNPLPDHLRAAGYKVYPEGTAERILPGSKVEWLVKGSDGSFDLATPGSTKTPAARVSHAGVHQVDVYSFDLNSQKR